MISVVYCSKESQPTHIEHLKKSSGIKNIEVIEYINKGEGLTKFYNKGLQETKYDIVVFCHNDINLNTVKWGKKIISHFEKTDFGILGVAGTTDIPSSGRWWEDSSKMLGQVKHTHNGKYWLSAYCPNFGERVLKATIVDGLFFAVHKKRIQRSFDEKFKGFHFYEIDFCFTNHLLGVNIGVVSNIRITHQSLGETNQEWENNRKQFIKKYDDELPYTLVGDMIYDSTVPPLKHYPKIGVVIPTKGNIELLTKCINSFWDKDDYSNMVVYIADTGSTDAEKDSLNKLIYAYTQQDSKNRDIRLIEYDYYNFAQINNDVVENHLDDDTTLILFCNNDIELINNAISKMVNIFDKKKNVGTVGARLYFEDNKIQHGSIMAFVDQGGNIRLTHKGLNTYYNYHPTTIEVLGNTAAFMMIKKEIFTKLGGFNETYKECFEDVELNVLCLSRRLKNYFVPEAVCYHYESQTRNQNTEKNKREGEDLLNRLIPFIIKNKRSYEYFENISATQLNNLLQQRQKETQHEIRHQL